MTVPSKKISVVMCTYNGERFLREQLDSILNQTLLPVEIIVQDDGSTDSTDMILAEYAAKSSLIKLFKNEGEHGINSNFFTAMRRASADYIALCDQDDIWEADKLFLQAEAIDDKMLCSGFSVPFSTEGYPVSFDHRRPNYHILRVAYLGALPGHTFLIKKKLLSYLSEGERCPYLYDWQLQLVAAAAESIAFVDSTLVHFRRHAGAATANLPVDNHFVSKSTRQYITITLFHHRKLQAAVRERFKIILTLLDSFPFQTQSIKDCREMAMLQIHRGLMVYCKKTLFFLRQRHQLFYAGGVKPILLWLRALYFPFSCGYYYRYVLKGKK
jgi:glycosyltransferase involved in cell wall biosynthesis